MAYATDIAATQHLFWIWTASPSLRFVKHAEGPSCTLLVDVICWRALTYIELLECGFSPGLL